MTYRLVQLAPGSYDVQLNGELVASLVQSRSSRRWYAELLSVREPLPASVEKAEHGFATFAEAVTCLGDPEVIHTVEGETLGAQF